MFVDYNDRNRIFYYIVGKNKTLREVANILGTNKSTLHYYIHHTMWKFMDDESYDQLCRKLEYNFNIKHIRGGLATKNKWHKLRVQKWRI